MRRDRTGDWRGCTCRDSPDFCEPPPDPPPLPPPPPLPLPLPDPPPPLPPPYEPLATGTGLGSLMLPADAVAATRRSVRDKETEVCETVCH